MPYASLACDMTSASEVAVAAWGALQVLYAFAFAFVGGICEADFSYILSLAIADDQSLGHHELRLSVGPVLNS